MFAFMRKTSAGLPGNELPGPEPRPVEVVVEGHAVELLHQGRHRKRRGRDLNRGHRHPVIRA